MYIYSPYVWGNNTCVRMTWQTTRSSSSMSTKPLARHRHERTWSAGVGLMSCAIGLALWQFWLLHDCKPVPLSVPLSVCPPPPVTRIAVGRVRPSCMKHSDRQHSFTVSAQLAQHRTVTVGHEDACVISDWDAGLRQVSRRRARQEDAPYNLKDSRYLSPFRKHAHVH
jgi:hypothetical protein